VNPQIAEDAERDALRNQDIEWLIAHALELRAALDEERHRSTFAIDCAREREADAREREAELKRFKASVEYDNLVRLVQEKEQAQAELERTRAAAQQSIEAAEQLAKTERAEIEWLQERHRQWGIAYLRLQDQYRRLEQGFTWRGIRISELENENGHLRRN
jgi:hypothetical protein